MAHRVEFLMHVRRESWSRRDHTELTAALVRAGFIPEGGAWRGHGVSFVPSVRPSRGTASVRFRADDWQDRPRGVAAAAASVARVVAERADVTFASGPSLTSPPRPRRLADVRALGVVNVLGADMVAEAGLERVHEMPGLVAEPLPFGGALLRLPETSVAASWTPDVEARILDAEMHLGLRLDPSRYPRLSGPAADYLRRKGLAS